MVTYQRAYFPMEVINISQGYGNSSTSHKLSYALDLSGSDTGKDNIYAPFDCIVVKLYQPKDVKNHANTIWLTSLEKVLSPNGYYGYLTISITHPREITYMKLGQKFKQGDFLFTEGNTGRVSGNHIHLEVAIGKSANWILKKKGSYQEYVILNAVKPEEYLFIKDKAIIKNKKYKNKQYDLKKEEDITYKIFGKDSICLYKDDKLKKKSNHVLKNGDEVIRFFNKNNASYIYNYGRRGYVDRRYLRKK